MVKIDYQTFYLQMMVVVEAVVVISVVVVVAAVVVEEADSIGLLNKDPQKKYALF